MGGAHLSNAGFGVYHGLEASLAPSSTMGNQMDGWMARLLRVCIWLSCGGLAPAAFAQSALVTIADGDAVAIEGIHRFAVARGERLEPGTLIETGAQLNLLRVEWPNGSVADFGPETLAMLMPQPLRGRGPRPAFYLLRGWAKQSSLGTAPAAGQATPALEIDAFQGALVTHVAPSGSFLFVESGHAAAIDRSRAGSPRVELESGKVFFTGAAGNWAVASKLTPEQRGSVPMGFRDTLPLLAARFAGKTVPPPPSSAPTYTELKPWLTAERELRRVFPGRFASLARNPAFRKGLVENLAAHPEWTDVLYPKPVEPQEGASAGARR